MRLNRTKVCHQYFTISEPGIARQGSNQLYQGHGNTIHKGHLNPVHINSYDANNMADTFTYANAVPQYAGFNQGKWKQFEMKIADYAKTKCAPKNGDMYVLTGTSRFRISPPDAMPLKRTSPVVSHLVSGVEKIEIPNSMWTAFCCVFPGLTAESLAVIGNNVEDPKKINIQEISVSALEDFLSLNNKQVSLFPGKNNLCG